MRLLIVEDDPLLGDGMQAGLRQAGFSVNWVHDGRAAEAALASEGYSALVLDLGLPGEPDGLALLAALRRRGAALPTLIVTARDTVADKLAGLDGGADDYLVKPFDLDELAARLRALIRRSHGRPTARIVHGEMEVDVAARQATLRGAPVELSAREFALLEALLEHRGRVMPRARLETLIYGWNEEPESNAVEVHIHHLRRKLGSTLIRTVRGVGYTIDPTP
ncbi:response regulator [Rhodocyclus tenuis]|uniref:Response regulator n=1 Tax=Rhodocyclus gracilis TaxID=2929842 RepID=A0ABX0WGY8_9RHOO|nr:response regulator [Rhodocyclus gracilis]NJA88126.1 response regulator [Rhodocyclus gracilis]